MSKDFNSIDFSKYAKLRELWDKHPSNKEGAYSRGGYSPAEGEAAQVLKRYGELSQQLSDELGGGDRATEAMLALGAVGGIGNGLTEENLGDPKYYSKMMDRRNEYIAQGHSAAEADAIEPFRFASVLMGERQPDLNYVQADKARRFAAQYGTPQQTDYTNQLATQLRAGQPSPSLTGLLNTSPFQTPTQPKAATNPVQSYLKTLETPYYIELIKRMARNSRG